MKTLLKVLTAFFALGLSASAAYFSVLGLTKMFAGAVLGTAIVCSFIEGSKLLIASVLHQFSKQLNWAIKGMLVIFLLLAMGITSMGVYGYLTNAFQSTANQLEVIDGQTKVLQMKRDRFNESLVNYTNEKKDLTESITELTKGLSNNVVEYRDRNTGEIIRSTSAANRKTLEKQAEDAKVQRDKLTLKIEALTDSVTSLDIEILNLNSNEDLAAEIGPLKFITKLTGLEMDVVVNFLTLILVLIVDPLAIVLVIVFNKISKDKLPTVSVPFTQTKSTDPDPDVTLTTTNDIENEPTSFINSQYINELEEDDDDEDDEYEVINDADWNQPWQKTTSYKLHKDADESVEGKSDVDLLNDLEEEPTEKVDNEITQEHTPTSVQDEKQETPKPTESLKRAAQLYKEMVSKKTVDAEKEFYGEDKKINTKRIG